MRTTLTIDADLAEALRRLAERTGTTWKEVVNEVLRRGLEAGASPPSVPYRTPVSDPGPPRWVGVHSTHELLALAEGEDFR